MASISRIDTDKARVGIMRGGSTIKNYILYPLQEVITIDLGSLKLVSCNEGEFMLSTAFIESSKDDLPYDVTHTDEFFLCGDIQFPIYAYNLIKFNKYSWDRYGGYEVSSRGDQSFSAFFARLPDGRSIEQAYQLDVKGYRMLGNDPKIGKGKKPIRDITPEEQALEYILLWWEFSRYNKPLIDSLRKNIIPFKNKLSDKFAKNEINQARALSEVLNAEDMLAEGIVSADILHRL